MSVPAAVQSKAPSGKRAVYYYPAWATYQRNYQIKDIPVDHITDIAYSFFNISSDGTVFSGDEWADFDNPYIGKGVEPQNKWDPPSPPHHLGLLGQLWKLKHIQKKPVNVLLAIGGWTWSRYFSDAMSTSVHRDKIVASLRRVVLRYPGLLSGFSWDHEYLSDDGVNYGAEGNTVRKEDAANFIELMKVIRKVFPGFTNALCVSAAPEKVHLPLKALSEYVDRFDVMTYDLAGFSGETITAHHSNPRKSSFGKWSAEQAADFFIAQGVPSSKVLIGGSLYSRGFKNSAGFGKPGEGISLDYDFPEEVGIVSYHRLPLPGATEYVDPESKGAYSFDPKRRVVNTYDSVDSIKEKCKIVWEKDLGGIIFWEASGDVRDYKSPRSIMRTVAENLTHCKPDEKKPAPPVGPVAPTPKPPGPAVLKPVVLKPAGKK